MRTSTNAHGVLFLFIVSPKCCVKSRYRPLTVGAREGQLAVVNELDSRPMITYPIYKVKCIILVILGIKRPKKAY